MLQFQKAILALLLLCAFAPAAEACLWWSRPAKRLPRSLVREIEALVPDSLLVQLELVALDADGPRTLHSRHGDVAGPPGSLVKLATAAAALELLGPEHRFVTRLSYSPADVVLDGSGRHTLDGPLVLRPGGDPTLRAEDLRRLAAWLWSRGIDSLAGPVVVDPARFDDRRLGPGWMWDDGSGAWAARIGAACVDGNGLLWHDGAAWPLPGATRLRVVELPAGGERTVISRDWPAQRDDFFLRRGRASAEMFGAGSALDGWTVPGGPYCNAEHPDSLFRAVFEEALVMTVGLAGPVEIRRSAFAEAQIQPGAVVLEHAGPRLATILDSLLSESWNLGAECVFQELAAARAERVAGPAWPPQPGEASWEAAGHLVESVLRDSLGVAGAFCLVDGSGMSRYDALRPSQICALLASSESRRPGELCDLLPAPGEGTLSDLSPPPGAAVRAKTGSLRGRHGLAGYLLLNGRPRYAFCLVLSGQRGGSGEIVGLRDELLSRLSVWCGKDGTRRGKR